MVLLHAVSHAGTVNIPTGKLIYINASNNGFNLSAELLSGVVGQTIITGVANNNLIGNNLSGSVGGSTSNLGGVNIGYSITWDVSMSIDGSVVISYTVVSGVYTTKGIIDTLIRAEKITKPVVAPKLPNISSGGTYSFYRFHMPSGTVTIGEPTEVDDDTAKKTSGN